MGDAALLLDVATGNHEHDLHRPPAASEPFAAAARRTPVGLRIALSFATPLGVPSKVHDDVRATIERAARSRCSSAASVRS